VFSSLQAGPDRWSVDHGQRWHRPGDGSGRQGRSARRLSVFSRSSPGQRHGEHPACVLSKFTPNWRQADRRRTPGRPRPCRNIPDSSADRRQLRGGSPIAPRSMEDLHRRLANHRAGSAYEAPIHITAGAPPRTPGHVENKTARKGPSWSARRTAGSGSAWWGAARAPLSGRCTGSRHGSTTGSSWWRGPSPRRRRGRGRDWSGNPVVGSRGRERVLDGRRRGGLISGERGIVHRPNKSAHPNYQ